MDKKLRESSKKQRQLIGMACTHFGMSRDDKKAMLLERYGEESSSDLNYAQAEELLDDFVEKGFKIESDKAYLRRKQKTKGMTALASPAEHSKIEALSGLIEWRVQSGFERWMKKRYKIERVRTAREAFVVIEGLKAMFASAMEKKHGENWWWQDFEDLEICRFIVEHHPAMVTGLALPAYKRLREYENGSVYQRRTA